MKSVILVGMRVKNFWLPYQQMRCRDLSIPRLASLTFNMSTAEDAEVAGEKAKPGFENGHRHEQEGLVAVERIATYFKVLIDAETCATKVERTEWYTLRVFFVASQGAVG